MRSSARSLLRMVGATVLLGPVVLLAGFFLIVQTVTSGWIFGALAWLVAMLPADPALGGAIFTMLLLPCLALLLLACILVPRLYPVLLLVAGGLSEAYVIVLTDPDTGAMWVPILGAAGLVLAALQVRNSRQPRRGSAQAVYP